VLKAHREKVKAEFQTQKKNFEAAKHHYESLKKVADDYAAKMPAEYKTK